MKYNVKNLKAIFLLKKLKKMTFLSFFILFSDINLTTSLRIMSAAGLKYGLKLIFLKKKKLNLQLLYFLIKDIYFIDYASIKNHALLTLPYLDTYNGIRYNKGLPIRGQRTRTNARTRRFYKTV